MLCNISFSFSFYGENIKRRLHLSSPIQVSSYRLLHDYVGKKLEKKIIFFWKNIFVFTKYTFFAEKNVFILKKKFYNEEIFSLKKTFFTEKNYISFQKYIFTQKILVLQIKYESFLNSAKKHFLIIKNIFVKTSLWTQ